MMFKIFNTIHVARLRKRMDSHLHTSESQPPLRGWNQWASAGRGYRSPRQCAPWPDRSESKTVNLGIGRRTVPQFAVW